VSRLVVTPVRTPTEKLEAVASIATEQFLQEKRLLILVEHEKAATFVDELLWKMPPDSFLPHVLASERVDEPIAISTKEENINEASALLSLLPIASTIATQFEVVYDLDDLTSDERQALSLERRRAYKAMGVSC